jgi:Asp-tRNA(Asn)/Glu-tRNA(Gln) amidotransferase A subunit family amidase
MSGLLADDDYVGHGITVDGTELQYYFDALLTSVFNVLSRCPVLNVPSGFSDNGVPTGVQIAGRSYDDETVFRIGSALEAVRPWLDTPERRPKLDL